MYKLLALLQISSSVFTKKKTSRGSSLRAIC